LRVLVACEYSGVVRRAFRERGHEAWSCDLLPSEDDSPYHIQCDIQELLDRTQWAWDLMIAHPPCTYLCNSGVRWLKEDEVIDGVPWIYRGGVTRWDRMLDAKELFEHLWEAPIPRICIENPVPHKYAGLPKYSQTIQPWMFGEDASKRTCLWLKGLTPLTSTELISPGPTGKYANQTPSGQNKLGPSKNRALERSRTYAGIANAFASQWGEAL
jgi:hypothetical protein